MTCPTCLGHPFAPGEDGGVGVCAACDGSGVRLCGECRAEAAETDDLCRACADRAAKLAVLDELWPDAPQDCYVYAAFCRPIAGYFLPLPDGVRVHDTERADWPRLIPWSYLATPEPCAWPQLELLRLPAPKGGPS